MAGEREAQVGGTPSEFSEAPKARPLTHGEFYLAMKERQDKSGLGLRPELRSCFVGQERAYQQLTTAFTQSPPGTVIVLSEPFGTGKDTVLDVVTSDLMDKGVFEGHDVQRVHVGHDLREGRTFEEMDRGFSWVETSENWRELRKTRPKVLRINEVATTWGYSKQFLQQQLAIAGRFLGKEAPIMVLVGDDALKDPEIIQAVGSPSEPIYIPLNPLTPDMLKETLRLRLAYALERSPDEIDVDGMFDPEFLTALVPNTEYPVAYMRDSLVVLEHLGKQLRPTEEPLRISGALLREIESEDWYRRLWETSNKKRKFMLWMMQHINSHQNGEDLIHAMTLEDMMQACPLGLEPDEYKEDVVDEFAHSGNGLKKVRSSPNLYLPRQNFFLMAAFRAMPLDPQSDEGKREVRNMQRRVYDMADPGSTLDDSWNGIIRAMEGIYGWDEQLGRTLIQDVLDTYEERKKAQWKDRGYGK